MIPKKCFFTKGVGVHKEKLASFELALRQAGLAYCNLVLVSSIFPPYCKRLSKEEGAKLLRPGEIVFSVYDRESTNEPNRLVAASVGVAIPSGMGMALIGPCLSLCVGALLFLSGGKRASSQEHATH